MQHQEEELSSVEVILLHGAARLLTAVKWIAEHPPLPEKWTYLNEKVNEEIRSIGAKYTPYTLGSNARIPRLHPIVQIMIAEWKTVTDSGQNPRWHIFTDAYIKQYCDQVATENPTWNPDLYATNLSLYVAETPARKQWWVLPGSTRPSAAQRSDDVTMADASASGPPVPSMPAVAAPPPPPPVATGLLTRSRAQKAEAPLAAPTTPTPRPSTTTYTGKGKKRAASPEDSPKENIQSNKEHTQKKATEMLPGVPVPSVHVEGASPPWPKAPAPPIATGDARCGQCQKADQPTCEAEYGCSGRLRTTCKLCHGRKKTCHLPRPPWAIPLFDTMYGVGQGLDEDTHRQLNRIEAMLTGICGSKGIIPENLPGYERCRSASPSSLSPSSPGMHMETLNISDTHSNTSAQSSTSSEPPRKAGEAAPPSEAEPVVAQAPPIRVTHHWEGFKADKFFFLR
ncbi:hypothetical protein V8E53_000726 [Lactarius tabidus]